MDNVEPLTIKIPNKDTYMAYATVCPKEVLQDMWIKK